MGKVCSLPAQSERINHSCAPNCETDEEHGRVFVFARSDLEKGTELFFDYQLEPADRRTKKLERLFRCDCASAKCRETMLGPV
jgi:SET domain-containing protein